MPPKKPQKRKLSTSPQGYDFSAFPQRQLNGHALYVELELILKYTRKRRFRGSLSAPLELCKARLNTSCESTMHARGVGSTGARPSLEPAKKAVYISVAVKIMESLLNTSNPRAEIRHSISLAGPLELHRQLKSTGSNKKAIDEVLREKLKELQGLGPSLPEAEAIEYASLFCLFGEKWSVHAEDLLAQSHGQVCFNLTKHKLNHLRQIRHEVEYHNFCLKNNELRFQCLEQLAKRLCKLLPRRGGPAEYAQSAFAVLGEIIQTARMHKKTPLELHPKQLLLINTYANQNRDMHMLFQRDIKTLAEVCVGKDFAWKLQEIIDRTNV